MIYSETNTWLKALQTGDGEAYKYLFSTYYDRLQRYALHFVLDESAAHDIVQDSFVQLWEKRDAIVFTSVQGLLFKIVRNNCLNYLRHQVIRNQYFQSLADGDDSLERLYNTDFFYHSDTELLYKELQQEIDEVLGELPERSKEIFEISRLEGLKNREIAERLGISIKIVERHIGRALQLLAKRLKK